MSTEITLPVDIGFRRGDRTQFRHLVEHFFPGFVSLASYHLGQQFTENDLFRDLKVVPGRAQLWVDVKSKNDDLHKAKEVHFSVALSGGRPDGEVVATAKSRIDGDSKGPVFRPDVFQISASLGKIFQNTHFLKWMNGEVSVNPDSQNESNMKVTNVPQVARNRILYGPPGTGKTYETIHAALQILDPEIAETYRHIDDDLTCSFEQRLDARKALKARFDKRSAEQRVRFVTFHQSFSYEDFVEGLRAESNETTEQLRYEVVEGVFKSLCTDAQSGGTISSSFEQAVERLQEKLEASGGRLELKTVRGKAFEVRYEGGKTFRVFPLSTESDDPYYVASMENVRKLFAGDPKKGMYNQSYVEGMLRYLQAECGLPAMPETSQQQNNIKPYVLIIDEINRGNISRIFGELITLIEPSKRAGAEEALSVTLPYSKDPFSVPDNVYLIGTMNTADRSLAGLDLALRRRFSFIEMPPRPDLLDRVTVESINIGQMLRVMNQRISVLLDRDHTLGHAYFMPLQTEPTLARLAAIFRQAILPLLQEYFFEDWERIRWVLNDQNKPEGEAFIVEDKTLELSALFVGLQNDRLRERPKWRQNDQAFGLAAAYRGIVANLGGAGD